MSLKICCVCVLRSVFVSCVLCSVSWSCVLKYYVFFNKIIILTKNLNLSFYSIHIWKPKTYLFKLKNPFKLQQNPVTQSILKLQRETHYALSGALMHCRAPSMHCRVPRGVNVGCYCSLGPKKIICLANEKVYIFAWNLSFSALGTCIQFS